MEGNEQIIKPLAAQTVIMPPSTARHILLEFFTTKHPKSGHSVNLAIDNRKQHPPIMDYLVIERDFRKKGGGGLEEIEYMGVNIAMTTRGVYLCPTGDVAAQK